MASGSAMSQELVRPGDVLVEVNGQSVRQMPFSRVLALLDSPPSPSDNKPTSATSCCELKDHRRAAAKAGDSPGIGIQTASPSTERSTPASDSYRSPVGPRSFPPSPPALGKKSRASAPLPPPAGGGKFASRRHRFSFDGLGHGNAMKALFTSPRAPMKVMLESPRAPITPSKPTLSARLAAWGGGTPGGKRTPRIRLRQFGRALTFGSSPRFPVSLFQEPRPPSPCTTPVGRRSLQPVTVIPARMTTLKFLTCRKNNARAAATLERNGKFRAGSGTRTHERVVAYTSIFDKEEEEEEDHDCDEEKLQSYNIPVIGARDSNRTSPFYDTDEETQEEEEEEEEEEAGVRPPSPDGLEGMGDDEEGKFFARSSSGVAPVAEAEDGEMTDEAEVTDTDDHADDDDETVSTVTAVSMADDTAVTVAAAKKAGFEEDEVVSLWSYLACADRGWPWKGNTILWAEYVSLSGRHRWIRSEGCRHALLLVSGAMYLLELPADAANRHNGDGPKTRAPGGWFLKLSADDLKSITIPLPPAETTPPVMADDLGERFALAATSSSSHGVFDTAKGEIIFHGKSGGSAWLECTSAGSRDALADVVSAWHIADTKNSTTLKASRVSMEKVLEMTPRGNSRQHIVSLLAGRTAHRTW